MIRSILAIVAGYLVMAIGVGLSTVAASLLLAGSLHAPPTPAYLAANVILSLLFAMLGGWIAAAIARRAPLRHAAILAVIMLLLGVVSVAMQTPEIRAQQPTWYSLVITIGGPIMAMVGGMTRRPAAFANKRGQASELLLER